MTATEIVDPEARFRLLSGDDWGPWFAKTLREAESSVLVSVYMISHHWRVPNRFKLDLLNEMAQCGRRGLACRGIVAASSQINTREAFNRTAAEILIESGWKIRRVEGPRLLHEKIALVDRQLCVIGSHNISKASLASNHDTSIAIRSLPLAESVHALFWRRWRAAQPWSQADGPG